MVKEILVSWLLQSCVGVGREALLMGMQGEVSLPRATMLAETLKASLSRKEEQRAQVTERQRENMRSLLS